MGREGYHSHASSEVRSRRLTAFVAVKNLVCTATSPWEPNERHVALAVADSLRWNPASSRHEGWPGTEAVAAWTGLCKRTVGPILKRLTGPNGIFGSGVVQDQRRPGRPRKGIYFVPTDAEFPAAHADNSRAKPESFRQTATEFPANHVGVSGNPQHPVINEPLSESFIEPLTTNAAAPLVSTSMAMTLTAGTITTTTTTWHEDACRDWTAAYGGIAHKGRIGQALAPLVKKLGWEEPLMPSAPPVRPVWQKYLAQKEPAFASPQDFAAKFGVWWRDGAGDQSLSDRNRRAGEAWLRQMEARERGEGPDDAFYEAIFSKPHVQREEDGG